MMSLRFHDFSRKVHARKYKGTTNHEYLVAQAGAKIQQTKMLVRCQMFGDLFLFGLIWQYSSNHKTYNKGRFKVIAKVCFKKTDTLYIGYHLYKVYLFF